MGLLYNFASAVMTLHAMHVVSRVRRRGENIHPSNLSHTENVGRQGILVFY